MTDKIPLEKQVSNLQEELHRVRLELQRARDVLRTLLEFEPALRRYRTRRTNSDSWYEEQHWELERLNQARYFRDLKAADEQFGEPVVAERVSNHPGGTD